MIKLYDNRYKYKILFSCISGGYQIFHALGNIQGKHIITNDLKAKIKICW